MTTPLRKPHPSPVGFEFRVPGFEFEKSWKINLPIPGGDVVAAQCSRARIGDLFARSAEQQLKPHEDRSSAAPSIRFIGAIFAAPRRSARLWP